MGSIFPRAVFRVKFANADADGAAWAEHAIICAEFKPRGFFRKVIGRRERKYVLSVEKGGGKPHDEEPPPPDILFVNDAQEVGVGLFHKEPVLPHQDLGEVGVTNGFRPFPAGRLKVGHGCGRPECLH
jgi:hypothetical protein